MSTVLAPSTAVPSTREVGPLSDPSAWQVVLVDRSGQVVLHNRARNEFSVRSSRWEAASDDEEEEAEELEVISQQQQSDEEAHRHRSTRSSSPPPLSVCPLCRRPTAPPPPHDPRSRRLPLTKDSNYFTLLSEANSLANTPRTTRGQQPGAGGGKEQEPALDKATLNSGYFGTFFEEIQLLGRGGAGSVHLVRHVLNGEQLGLYACKKVAVGDSSPSLLRILREVHLLEVVQHPNIVTYHHAWVENSSLSAYSPSVPTLHILMAYANGGSLDSFINQRRGGPPNDSEGGAGGGGEATSAKRRKEKHRMRNLGAVHLLRLDEILQLFEDIVNGLAFLHARNILHLDMKAENVLLHWEEDDLLPTAKLSDFGNATSDAWTRERTGGSGTLAYTAPESWEHDVKTGRLHTPDRATDQWALGLILHLLSFFTLPYYNEDDMALLEPEIRAYPGFFIKDAESLDHGTRHDVPAALLRLIARLVHRQPSQRPSCEKVLMAIQQLKMEAFSATSTPSPETSALVRSPSPNPRRLSPDFVSTRLPGNTSEATLTKVDETNAPVTVALPPTPSHRISPLLQRQLLAAAFAMVKLAALQQTCRSTSPAHWTLYALLLAVVIDLVVADVRLAFALAGLHFVGVGIGKEYVCAL
ncbi:kinase-like domain-containing protein [Leucosporidium creatinivorum]|uniref:Kinase-like domain-containing protein n=1 Tax=Leucosporidium creatinivorum TaxID=106004 RepID=A0A1Y2END9_9BASI|nr:kinase-like domain-containing protein [Leucosporidium creatinivorum]